MAERNVVMLNDQREIIGRRPVSSDPARLQRIPEAAVMGHMTGRNGPIAGNVYFSEPEDVLSAFDMIDKYPASAAVVDEGVANGVTIFLRTEAPYGGRGNDVMFVPLQPGDRVFSRRTGQEIGPEPDLPEAVRRLLRHLEPKLRYG